MKECPYCHTTLHKSKGPGRPATYCNDCIARGLVRRDNQARYDAKHPNRRQVAHLATTTEKAAALILQEAKRETLTAKREARKAEYDAYLKRQENK